MSLSQLTMGLTQLVYAPCVAAITLGIVGHGGRKKMLLAAFVLLPVRALLFTFLYNPYVLTAIQLLDGLGTGLFGVVSRSMIAALSKGTGRFNLL
jgi:MFS family permease